MERPVVAVVMAGGSGTRLYPASRSDRPKQLLALDPDSVDSANDDAATADESLLRRTLDRAALADHRVVVTTPDHADRVREHLADHPAEVWVEPATRDTGPALVYAAGRARAAFDRPVLWHLPSDHHVAGAFGAVAKRAITTAVETGGLVCVGVEPDRPATGYGYVRPGREVDGYASVAAFHEKPTRDGARDLVDRGALWNAGVFAWTPSAFLSAARETPLAPVVEAVDPWDRDRIVAGYERVDPVSVDHAVMERVDDVYVVPADGIEWDDLGTWDALGRVLPADENGTVVAGDALAIDTRDTVVATDDDDTHVTTVGVEDLVVAAYDDRVLVAPRGATDRVREAVERLREEDRF